ncbi:MAG TPA: prolipoprotein diacylglyceryl transferase [Prevotella sp.]|nr:prolipoprotein diacylglyceryl transferase [Prevotella sp.]
MLYIYWNPSEIIFHIGSFGVRWYATCWLIGLLLGYLLMHRIYREEKIAEEKFDPLFFYIFIGVLVGARLGHCLFYQPDYFLSSVDHFIEMIVPMQHMPDGSWHYTGYAGLASHGGVIGMLIGIWLYCRRTRVPGWVVLDNMGICSGITATFIRLGNLMNSEIIGKVTDVPWAFVFERVDGYPRHPGQLYEALTYLVIFLVILTVYRKHRERVGTGLFFGLCLALIFTSRFLIEYTKDIQVDFEAGMLFDMGQLLSVPFIAIGLFCIFCKSGMKKLGAKPWKQE